MNANPTRCLFYSSSPRSMSRTTNVETQERKVIRSSIQRFHDGKNDWRRRPQEIKCEDIGTRLGRSVPLLHQAPAILLVLGMAVYVWMTCTTCTCGHGRHAPRTYVRQQKSWKHVPEACSNQRVSGETDTALRTPATCMRIKFGNFRTNSRRAEQSNS